MTLLPCLGSSRTGTVLLENFIGGSFVPSVSQNALDVTNPASGEVLARVPLSVAGDVDAALTAARRALPAWRSLAAGERTAFIFALRDMFRSRLDDIAQLVTLEGGKTAADARAEVTRTIELLEAACATPMTMQGRVLEGVARGVNTAMVRQPVGVCAAMTPFNFPAMVPMWFLPFAIACGNTFLLKPSEQAPLTSEMIVRMLAEAGLPAGVVNIVHGSRDAANAILEHPAVGAVSFVGSVATARQVYARAALSGKRVQALGGAKNYMIVLPDAVLDKAVPNILGSAFGNAGQRCMAGSVLLLVGEAKHRVLEPLGTAAEKLVVGDPAAAVDVGPVISAAARDRILACIEKGLAEGASLLVDGRDPPGVHPGGWYVGPTILDGVTSSMSVAIEEIFGPVLSVMCARTLDEAIDLVNADPRGNGSSIFTENGAAIRRFTDRVEAGMVGVNVGVPASPAYFPFSGWKNSFFGDLHAHGFDAVEFFTRKKTITSRFFSSTETGRFFTETDRSH